MTHEDSLTGVWPGDASEYDAIRRNTTIPVRLNNLGMEYVIVASAYEPCNKCAFSAAHQSEYCWNVDCENLPWGLYTAWGLTYAEAHPESAFKILEP